MSKEFMTTPQYVCTLKSAAVYKNGDGGQLTKVTVVSGAKHMLASALTEAMRSK